jgi:hypothetical protein
MRCSIGRMIGRFTPGSLLVRLHREPVLDLLDRDADSAGGVEVWVPASVLRFAPGGARLVGPEDALSALPVREALHLANRLREPPRLIRRELLPVVDVVIDALSFWHTFPFERVQRGSESPDEGKGIRASKVRYL